MRLLQRDHHLPLCGRLHSGRPTARRRCEAQESVSLWWKVAPASRRTASPGLGNRAAVRLRSAAPVPRPFLSFRNTSWLPPATDTPARCVLEQLANRCCRQTSRRAAFPPSSAACQVDPALVPGVLAFAQAQGGENCVSTLSSRDEQHTTTVALEWGIVHPASPSRLVRSMCRRRERAAMETTTRAFFLVHSCPAHGAGAGGM